MSSAASGPIVLRYATALFGLAQRKGALEQVSGDVRRIADLVRAPKNAQFLLNPRIDRNMRVEQLKAQLGAPSPLVGNFLSLIFERGRESVLLGLGAAFHRLTLEAAGVVEGVAESARPLDRAQLDLLAQRLGARLGKRVQLQNQVTPELIGGVRVTVGSQRIDQSIAGRLSGLRRRMLEAPLSARGR